MAERVKLSPELLTVWRGIQERKTPMVIAGEMGFSRAWVNRMIDMLVGYGIVHRRGSLPADVHAEREYPWYAAMDVPVLPPNATLRLEYVPESQRDHRVKPVIQVGWGPWDVQGVPYLREDGRRPKDQLPERKLVAITNLDTGYEHQFRASIRQRWTESDTRAHLAHVVTRETIQDITLNIACVLEVEAFFDLTGTEHDT